MHIVAAGVHRENFVAGNRIDLLRARGIRQPGFFLNGQPVHIGPHHDQRPLAVFQHCDHARAANALGHVETGETEFHRHATGRFMLDRGQLGVAMKVIEQVSEMLVVVLLNYIAQIARVRGHTDNDCQKAEYAFGHGECSRNLNSGPSVTGNRRVKRRIDRCSRKSGAVSAAMSSAMTNRDSHPCRGTR